jgi:hypothetical protein
MINKDYGIKKPESGDSGELVFDALGSNIDQQEAHTHDGTNSAKISAASISKSTVAVSSASWLTVTDKGWRKLITCPSGFNIESYLPIFRTSDYRLINPTIERVTSTTFYMTQNISSSLELTVIF